MAQMGLWRYRSGSRRKQRSGGGSEDHLYLREKAERVMDRAMLGDLHDYGAAGEGECVCE
jgi:hypothetical protein